MAERGDRKARARLQGLEWPPEVDYLRDWFEELDGRRVIDMAGAHPFTDALIEGWARMSNRAILVCEVDALIRIDRAILVVRAAQKSAAAGGGA